MSISFRTSSGMGFSSGKIISDARNVSFGKVVSSFPTIKYEFFPLCDLFSSLLALMKSRSRSSNCSIVNDSNVIQNVNTNRILIWFSFINSYLVIVLNI